MPRPNVRPLTRPIPAASKADAERALAIVEASLRTMVGTDAEPSDLWVELSTLPGTDPDGWELASDAALLCADIIEAIKDNLGNPQAIGLALFGVAAAAVPEIVQDVRAVAKP
ncbi:MAG TPA: hypothetical protein VMW48_08950 [Vicinamibacterales bacterium]|nr:hypothetical protein [Vicinamibacterales bacterium]